MRLAIGARLGAYEITGVLGSGGMGEVYRARDSRLGREVALKVLPEQLAEDVTAFSRFELEARAVAALSHPNILAIHEFGHANSTTYAVMELLEGATLRERLREGALPTRKAIEYAVQIAGALAAAHAKGIIHRDLKPENIFITVDGRVKLLDFGLAAQREKSLVGAESGQFRTLGHKTSAGMMLGTVGYMAPEQVRGEPADHRSDIFSLGCVLLEMLTGKRAFERDTPAEIMTAILREEAATITGTALETAPGIEHIVHHCLEKNPEERFQSARDLAFDLQAVLTGSPRSGLASLAASGYRARRTPRAKMLWAAGLLLAIGAVVAALVAYWPHAAPTPPLVLSEIVPPEGTQFGALAVSPDGHSLAFVGWKDGRGQLWVRSLESLASHPLAGTSGAAFPFWSADGAQIGFFADGRLKTIPASGGPVQTLADAPNARGGAWSEDGTILFAPGYDSPLYRISASGGAAEPVTQLDTQQGEMSHRWPCFLPGGKRFLYFVFSSSQDNTGIFAGSLDGKGHRMLVRSGYGAVYAAPGYLVFTRQKALLAQAFRADTLKLEGNPVTLADAIGVNELEYAHFSVPVSGGVLAYRRGGTFLGSELRWFGRDGRPQATIAGTDHCWSTRLSPDGRTVALEVQDPHTRANNIWIYDLERSTRRRRLTFGAYDTVAPQWSPDGRLIAYSARPQGRHYGLYEKSSSGEGQEEALLQNDGDALTQDWSRDGRFLLYVAFDSAGKRGASIWLLPTRGERKPMPLPQPTGDAEYPRFSPDSRWIAYRSNESGQNEIYVIPAQSADGKWQVSVGGGDWPVWRADGKELYYIAPDDRLMAVPVQSGATFTFGAPQPLFQTNVLKGLGSRYDASPDGQRFLFLVGKQEGPAPLTLVVNWTSALKTK